MYAFIYKKTYNKNNKKKKQNRKSAKNYKFGIHSSDIQQKE